MRRNGTHENLQFHSGSGPCRMSVRSTPGCAGQIMMAKHRNCHDLITGVRASALDEAHSQRI
jgi:hypothetical protein